MPPTKTAKHPAIIVRQEQPYNAGPPLHLLRESHITPLELFFVRNHGSVPNVDPATYRLEIDGAVGQALTLSLEDVRQSFPRAQAQATLQCAGNRRQELMAVRPIPGELGWGAEAISHAVWAGARLSDVLAAAGVNPGAAAGLHAASDGLDETERHGHRFHFGGSIPLEKAFTGDVLLAYEMNGQPLTPLHGAPLRVVVPGYIGARSVKWLRRITVQGEPSGNYFQRRAYRLFPPDVTADNVDWNQGQMLGPVHLTAVICDPAPGARLPAGSLTVRGYAYGGEIRYLRVAISADGGQSWVDAEMEGPDQPMSWRFWRGVLDLPPGDYTLIVRAVGEGGVTQPPDPAPLWNFKGYMNNAWHLVPVRVG
jgi:sulfite oxidase